MEAMSDKRKRLDKMTMEMIARDATKNALQNHEWITPEQEINLTLGTGIEENVGIFELYLASDRPRDAIFLTRATVSRIDGSVEVKVFLPEKKLGPSGTKLMDLESFK